MDTWVEAVLVVEYDLGLDKNLSDSDSNLWAKLLWVGLRENVLELRLHLTFLLVGAHTQYTDMETALDCVLLYREAQIDN